MKIAVVGMGRVVVTVACTLVLKGLGDELVPVVLGRAGVLRQLQPELNGEERQAFLRSAEVVRAAIAKSLQAP